MTRYITAYEVKPEIVESLEVGSTPRRWPVHLWVWAVQDALTIY